MVRMSDCEATAKCEWLFHPLHVAVCLQNHKANVARSGKSHPINGLCGYLNPSPLSATTAYVLVHHAVPFQRDNRSWLEQHL